MEEERAAVVAHVLGRVQGVSYRAWTCAKARDLGLTGWVSNEADGSVRALIVGPHAAVREMLAAMGKGPPGARVASVQVEREDADHLEAPQDFTIVS